MRTPGSTVVVLTGDDVPAVLRGLDRLHNVRAVSLRDDTDGSADVRPAAGTTYFVHDEDPLEHVASAWVEFFDDRTTLGTLDLEVETAVAAFAAGRASMPDYYVVLEPESIEEKWQHWWLGVLAAASPMRVLLVPPTVAAVRAQLRRLPAGRPWPDMREWLPTLRFALPDRASWPTPSS